MGKTALLLELAERCKAENFIPVRVAANDRMLDEIIEGIQLAGARFVDGKPKSVQSVSIGGFGFSVGLTFTEDVNNNYGFRTKLTLLCEALSKRNKGILFLVDEVQASTSEMREFATTYQHLVGDAMNVAFAMAGLPGAVSSVLNDDILTFLNRAHKVHLGPLPLNEISSYFFRIFSDMNIDADARLLDSLATSTKGYPYMLQLIGYHLMGLIDSSGGFTQTVIDLAVTNAKRMLIDNVYTPCLKPLSNEDYRFLKAMAVDEEVSEVADLKTRLKSSASHIQTYKQRLIEAGIIDSPGRGIVEFTIPYIGEYLRGE
ncbi:MAG: hypothetical protein LBL54_03745 [Clostridiales Family XIII bacterium]|nr:hypothetical protein [Clostridiales Family XIII bacterium]